MHITMKITQKQYQKAKEELHEEYQEKMKALELMWKQFGERNGSSRTANSPTTAIEGGRVWGDRTTFIVSLAKEYVGKSFSLNDIMPALEKKFPGIPYNSLAAAVKQLVKQGYVKETQKGTGRWKPTLYAFTEKCLKDSIWTKIRPGHI